VDGLDAKAGHRRGERGHLDRYGQLGGRHSGHQGICRRAFSLTDICSCQSPSDSPSQ
jgi:hypothetical protein